MICSCSGKNRKSKQEPPKPILQFKVTDKRLFYSRSYTLALTPSQLYIGSKIKLDLSLSTRISLKLVQNQVVGFQLENGTTFYAPEPHISDLLASLAGQVCFLKIMSHFSPVAMLGRGSSSEVFIVKEIATKVEYASKSILKSYLHQHPRGYEALAQEVAIMRRLSGNPLFIRLHSIFESHTSFYIILDYLRGLTLEQHMLLRQAQHKGYSCEEVIEIMRQLLLILRDLHAQNIMHRDLKPANIMFESPDSLNLKIIDFGLAQILDHPVIYQRCGTAGYVAPEVIRSAAYDKRCDVFSLGCICYKLITGKSLFKGKSIDLILENNKKCNFSLSDVPEYARHFLEGMLRIEPETRLTVEELLNHSFFGGDVTDRQNFEGIDERSRCGKVPDSSGFSLKLIKMSQKSITSLTSIVSQKSFYVKRSMNGLQKYKI